MNPENPMGELKAEPFPPHHHPAIAVFSLGTRQFVLMFGGQFKSSLSSTLFAIDLETLYWHAIPFDGPTIRGRMSAAMATVDTRVYIFGGVADVQYRRGVSRCATNTYSIAQYNCDNGKWYWLVRDERCPEDIHLCYGEQLRATTVYGGRKILLTGGHHEIGYLAELSSESCILFDTKFWTFQKLTHTPGQFPGSIHWYNMGQLDVSPQSRGRAPLPHGTFVSLAVIFAGWTNVEQHVQGEPDDLAPELWRYTLPPLEECQKLGVQEDLYALAFDLQKFVVVAGRLFFFGRKGSDDQVHNICVEVKI